MVVTSRSALAGLAAAEGAQPLRLGPLAAEEAVRLLAARLGSERVSAEPAAVSELAGWCGQLPLTLAVIAARAAADPDLPLSVLAAQLAASAHAESASAGAEAAGGSDAGTGLGRLEVLETGDPATSLRQLLSWSYRQLSPAAAGMFALLGVHCGPDIAVAGRGQPGRRSLRRGEPGAGRAGRCQPGYRAPGPAGTCCTTWSAATPPNRPRHALGEAGIRAAIERSLDHYLHTMLNSYGIPPPFPAPLPARGVLPEQLAGEAALLDWARAEHQVIFQAIAQAARTGLPSPTPGSSFSTRHGWWAAKGYWAADIRTASRGVLDAAEAAGDQAALGWTHLAIGRYGAFLGAGNEDLARALEHFEQAGDLSGQAWSHLHASLAHGVMGELAEGLTQPQALALFQQTADQPGKDGR